ncbi:DUF2780 domain-containing protein [Paraglaciecola sp. 2405UD69-4]|uniref:DUF2780 domain-containing protein n=1 Tax=Paraglaciecola sp. 2405UD69-4 TaxID=3391836 RepID=UPI0039C96342
MKISALIVLVGTLSFSTVSLSNDLLSSAKSLLSDDKTETSTSSLSVTDMIGSVSDSLGITESQATGSLGSIFDYAKENISAEQFSSISDSLPSLDTLMSAVPTITGDSSESSSSGLGGMLSKATEYSDSLSGLATLQQQFESLGLDADMISKVIQSAYTYLDTEQGQQVKALLQEGLSSLSL